MKETGPLLQGLNWNVCRGWKVNFPVGLLRHTFGVTVFAFHKVNVVRALGRFEGRIHSFNVQAAIGETGVTRRTGGTCQLAVIEVACKATQTFMHSDWSAVVARCNLPCRTWRVALIAKCLPRISADLNQTIAVFHYGQAQAADGNRFHFAAIEESQRGKHDLLFRSGRPYAERRRSVQSCHG